MRSEVIDESWLSASCFHVRLTRDAIANVVPRSKERMCFTSSDGSASMDMMSRSEEGWRRRRRWRPAWRASQPRCTSRKKSRALAGFKMTSAVKFAVLLLAPLASALFWESSPSPSAPARDGALGVVDNMINENKVTIFSNSKCTSSAKAKTVLEDMGVPYLAIELDQRLDGQSLKAVLAERTGAKSLPYVFVHGQHVGGAAETRRAYETGELSHWVDSHWPGKVEDSKVLDLEANT